MRQRFERVTVSPGTMTVPRETRSSRQPKRDTWAVFNLETDPDNFKFIVAVGPLVHEESKHEPPGLDFRHRRDERCSVFIHRERAAKGTRGPERKLEILPSVDESPIPILCQEQLLLALRLFKPDPFWVMAWDRRRDFQAPTLSRPYALRGPEVTAFCKFAKRLLDFHFDRNRYRVLRNHLVWVYVGQVVADEKLSDHPAPLLSKLGLEDG